MHQYLPIFLTFAFMTLAFGLPAYHLYRLTKFRKSVNPGHTVNFKSGDNVSFKEVIARPGKDFVILKNMDDNFSFRASIHKIYPL